MRPETRDQKPEVLSTLINVQAGGALLVFAFCLLISSCRTVGISKTSGGFAEISPPIAPEMILDSQQGVGIDIRPPHSYPGPGGHIPHPHTAPSLTIKIHLPPRL